MCHRWKERHAAMLGDDKGWSKFGLKGKHFIPFCSTQKLYVVVVQNLKMLMPNLELAFHQDSNLELACRSRQYSHYRSVITLFQRQTEQLKQLLLQI